MGHKNMGFLGFTRMGFSLLLLLSILEPILEYVIKGKYTLTLNLFYFSLTFTKQISLQAYFTIYLVGLKLVKVEERVSLTFVYMLV